jgi:hypothetical protein
VKATLEIESQSRVPKGTLIEAEGLQRRFSGWIEFASAIEDLRRVARSSGKSKPKGEQ